MVYLGRWARTGMRKRILSYRNKIDNLLKENSSQTDWESVCEEHLIQIGFFQHERLIHLLVTLTFAIMAMGVMGIIIISGMMSLVLLEILLLVLLVPYIMHYYLLENEVQHMYEQYDEMLKRLG